MGSYKDRVNREIEKAEKADRIVIELDREEAEALEGCWGYDPESVDAAERAMDKLRSALPAPEGSESDA